MAGFTRLIATSIILTGVWMSGYVEKANASVDGSSITLRQADAVASVYINKVNGQSLDSLFTGGLNSRAEISFGPAVVDLSLPIYSHRQPPVYSEIRTREVLVSPVPMDKADAGQVVSGASTGKETVRNALGIMGTTATGHDTCKELGARGCDVQDLADGEVMLEFRPKSSFSDPNAIAEAFSEWKKPIFFLPGVFHGYVRIKEDYSTAKVETALILTHEMRHLIQMKNFPEVLDNKGKDNELYAEIGAWASEMAFVQEISGQGLLSSIKDEDKRNHVALQQMLLSFWRYKSEGLSQSPVFSITLPTALEYQKKFTFAYNSTSNSNSFLLEGLKQLIVHMYGIDYKAPKTSPKFAKYIDGKVKLLDRHMREVAFGKRDQIYNCHKNDDTSGRATRGNTCDFSLEPRGVRMANLQMAAEDACSMYGRDRGTRVSRGDYGDMVAAQFRVAGLSLDVNSRLAVADRFEPDSCPYNLIRMTSAYSAFGVMNEYTLRHFIHDGFDFPEPANNSSDENGNDSSGDDSSNDDGGNDSGNDGSSNGWDSGHDYNPHFQPGI